MRETDEERQRWGKDRWGETEMERGRYGRETETETEIVHIMHKWFLWSHVEWRDPREPTCPGVCTEDKLTSVSEKLDGTSPNSGLPTPSWASKHRF